MIYFVLTSENSCTHTSWLLVLFQIKPAANVKEDSTTKKSVPGELLNYISLSFLRFMVLEFPLFVLDKFTSLVPVGLILLHKLV